MNLEDNYSVRFSITGVNYGFQEVHGLLKLGPKELQLEFEVQDSFVGFFKSGIQKFTISFGDIEDISFKKGMFSSKIILEATSMRALEGLPGQEPATRELKIKRKYREEAGRLVSRARMQLSEFKLDQMG